MFFSSVQHTDYSLLCRISNGQFYEAHQAVRTIVARYVRTKNYSEALEILTTSAESLLKASQSASGCDLLLYIVEVYEISQTAIDSTSRGRLLKLLPLVPPTEPSLNKLAKQISNWSHSDPELNHVLGSMFVSADDPYAAEKYLLLGTKDSAVVLADMLYEWFTEADDVDRAPQFLSRAVLGYLSVMNIRDAHASATRFIHNLQSQFSELEFTATSVPSDSSADNIDSQVFIYKDIPLLNFLQLLTVTVQYKAPEMYKRLFNRYREEIQNTKAWDMILSQIAEIFFGIAPARGNNMLQDLLGSLMMPGGGNKALGA